jgi:hypothetical protein
MNTDTLFEQAKTRFDHAVARQTLKEKYQAKMIFAHANGMWCAGPELINILTASIKTEQQELVLLDLYDTPVKVELKELLSIAQERWQEQMTAWLLEFEELRKKR